MVSQETKLDYRIFLRKISWAILSTNLFGMPLILIFIGGILNLELSQIGDSFKRDPYFFIIAFGSIAITASLFVALHFVLVLRKLKPIFSFLKSCQDEKAELKAQIDQAMRISLKTPSYTMYLSIILYVIAVALLIVFIVTIFRLTPGQIFSLFFTSLSVGVLISFFQYFTTRRVLIYLNDTILLRFPELVEDETLNSGKERIRNKMLLTIVTLCVALVILTGLQAYNYALRSFQYDSGNVYLARLEILGEFYQTESEQYFQLFVRNLQINNVDYFVLTNSRGEVLNGSADTGLDAIWRSILGIYPRTVIKNRPMVFRLSPRGIYSAVLSHRLYTVIHKVIDNEHHLFIISPEKDTERALRSLWIFSIIAALFALLLGLLYTRFAIFDLDLPLRNITQVIQQIARGNLQETVRVVSQDEIGTVALNIAKMLSNLRSMLGKIDSASASISQTSEQLSLHSEQIEQGASLQASSVEETSASIEEMNQSNKRIVESIETLARSAEESSASILEMSATIDEVAKNVEVLSEAVEETTSSLQEMNASLQEVAANAEQLNARNAEAMRSLKEMENAIYSVGEGASQTANLSEQVAEDAEQGAKAVEMTIKGIERIRRSSEDAALVIDSLSERAQEIGNILNVIDDITEETNLLALNAAIIAAQAGEHGKGFAVVADEIRDLAERTSASTKEIGDLIKSVQEGAQNAVATVFKSSKDVEEGVRLSQEAGAVLGQILKRARQSMERTREIAQAVSRQSEHAKEVMTFFDNLNAMISQVAQAVQEQTKGGDLIFKASKRMEQVAQQVKRATKEQTLGSKQITRAVENIAQIINYINTAQGEQLKNSQTVLEAVRHIRKVAEENSDLVKEMKNLVDGLSFLARDLNDMVLQFKIGIGKDKSVKVEEVFKL